jgi:predicted nucleic acid-binding protein
MILLDTSIWVSRIFAPDAHHAIAVQWFAARVKERETFAGPSFLLVETAGAIARRTSQSELGRRAADQLTRLRGFEIFPLTEALVASATKIAADLRLGGADAIFVATALEQNLPLATLDREVINKAAALVTVLAPA